MNTHGLIIDHTLFNHGDSRAFLSNETVNLLISGDDSSVILMVRRQLEFDRSSSQFIRFTLIFALHHFISFISFDESLVPSTRFSLMMTWVEVQEIWEGDSAGKVEWWSQWFKEGERVTWEQNLVEPRTVSGVGRDFGCLLPSSLTIERLLPPASVNIHLPCSHAASMILSHLRSPEQQ